MTTHVPGIVLALVALTHDSILADTMSTERRYGSPDSLYLSVDRYPYLEFPSRVPWPDERLSRADHFIICEAVIDTTGLVISVQSLGCEGEKGVLCEQVERSVSAWRFVPAVRNGCTVPVPVVFPVTFRAADDSGGRTGAAIVGVWDESRCAYDGRIYGSAELHPTNRPAPLRKEVARYPEAARVARVPGRVVLKIVVDPDGVPCFALCDSATPLGSGFVESATQAARNYRFSPGLKDGRSQAVWVEVPFRWEP